MRISAINAKTLEVTFNKAADVKAADFKVNKGTIKTNVAEVVLSEDKTVATIELSSKLTEGKYTVTVAQEDAEDLVGSVIVENEKVAAIKVLSDVAPFVTGTKAQATVKAEIQNQYGEDITRLNYSDVTVTAGGVATTATLDSTGKVTINLVNAKEGDNAVLTLVHGKTGVSTQATLKLSSESKISEITFGEIYNKDGKTLTQDTTAKDKFYIPVETKDQYDNKVTDLAKINGEILFTNSNPGVLTLLSPGSEVKKVTIDGEEVTVIEVTKASLAGTANIIAVSTTSGKSATVSVTVAEGVKFASVSLSAPTEIVTANTKLYFPLTLIDTAGNEIKTVKEFERINDDLTISGDNVTNKPVEREGKEGLFVEVDGTVKPVKENDAVTVVVTTGAGKVATQSVIAKAEAKATVITGISSKKTAALRANKAGVTVANTDLIVEDQFGQVITDETALGNILFSTEVEGAANIKALSATDAGDNKSTVIAPIANTDELSGKVTFKLATAGMKPADIEASAFAQTFTIVKNSEFESYEIEDIETIYAKLDSGDYKVVPAYNKPIVVKATTASGEVVELIKDTDYTETGWIADSGEVEFDTDSVTNKVKETKTEKVTVTIIATGDELTKEVTYSNVAPKVAEVKLVKADATDGVTDSDELAKIKEISSAKIASSVTGSIDLSELVKEVDFVVTDTYGLSVGSKDGTIELADTTDVSSTVTLTLSNGSEDVVFKLNGLAGANVEQYRANSTFDVVAKVSAVSSNKVKVTTLGEAAVVTANDKIAAAVALLPSSITEDTNLLNSLNAISGMSGTGATLSIKSDVTGPSESPQAKVQASDGVITKGLTEQVLNVIVEIQSADGVTVEKTIGVTIPKA